MTRALRTVRAGSRNFRSFRLGSIAVGLALASLRLSGCGVVQSLLPDDEVRDESGEITEGGNTDVFTLSEGDCLNDEQLSTSTEGESVEVSEVPTVPCTEPHDYEVYRNISIPDAETYPGDETITTSADSQCLEAFGAFVGLPFEESVLTFSYYYPTEASWADGDRRITCLILDDAGKTTGTLAGAAR